MSLAGLLAQSITLYNQTSYNAEGREVVGSGETLHARVQVGTKHKLQANGKVKVIDAIAYLPSDTTVDAGDRIDYDGENYLVVGVAEAIGGVGQINHIKVELTRFITT